MINQEFFFFLSRGWHYARKGCSLLECQSMTFQQGVAYRHHLFGYSYSFPNWRSSANVANLEKDFCHVKRGRTFAEAINNWFKQALFTGGDRMDVTAWFVLKHKMLHSEQYKRAPAEDNCTVLYHCGRHIKVEHFFHINTESQQCSAWCPLQRDYGRQPACNRQFSLHCRSSCWAV